MNIGQFSIFVLRQRPEISWVNNPLWKEDTTWMPGSFSHHDRWRPTVGHVWWELDSIINYTEWRQTEFGIFRLLGWWVYCKGLHPLVPGHSTRFLSAWMCVNQSMHVFVWIFKTLVLKCSSGKFFSFHRSTEVPFQNVGSFYFVLEEKKCEGCFECVGRQW